MAMITRTQVIVLSALALLIMFFGTAAAELDGRTDGDDIGLREYSQQTSRVHFSSGPGACYRVVCAGVRTRNADPAPPAAAGTIQLPAGPTDSNVVWAGLYWAILADAAPINGVTLNGHAVSPVSLGTTMSPCWPEISAFAYFADVTGLVTAGANQVAGLDDGRVLGVAPESEGASLVVVYEDRYTGACEIIVTDGNDLLDRRGQAILNPLPVACGSGIPARLYFIGADGQTGTQGPAPDNQKWNNVLLGGNDEWNASDPGAPGAIADLSWDTDSWAVTTGGGNTASVAIPLVGGPGDCLNWMATVIEVGVGTCVHPTGACCFPDGHCEFIADDVCADMGGTALDPGTLCDPNPCVQPNMACCFPNGDCQFISSDECLNGGGTPLGYGTDCDPNDCPQPPATGACCIGDQGECRILNSADCAAAGGIYQGDDSTCDPNPCTVVPTDRATWGRIKATYR